MVVPAVPATLSIVCAPESVRFEVATNPAEGLLSRLAFASVTAPVAIVAAFVPLVVTSPLSSEAEGDAPSRKIPVPALVLLRPPCARGSPLIGCVNVGARFCNRRIHVGRGDRITGWHCGRT